MPGRLRWACAAACAALLPGASAAPRCPPAAAIPKAPLLPTDYNGIAWPDFCFERRELEEHFFIIGDWGGLFRGENVAPITAFDSKGGRRGFLEGVDDRAQQLVAEQMKRRAAASQPRYLLNVGDNFYWGGIASRCGAGSDRVLPSTLAQWNEVFEKIYDGELLGKPWLGVLGNHDFGGYKFTTGWDQAIAYTWGGSDRWLTPALYWRTKVVHDDFTVDYFFVDSNVNDAFPPQDAPGHNMCSERNNPPNASCGGSGPSSVEACLGWFLRLWEEQVVWMDRLMPSSDADWLIVVTHFPPEYRREVWARLAESHGIDLIVTGHRHQQELVPRDASMGGAAWVVSGGGGGITSEGMSTVDGQDDQYGFMDVAISRNQIKIETISHSGIVRGTIFVDARRRSSSTRTATATTTTTMTATDTATSSTATATATATDTATATATSTATGTATATHTGTRTRTATSTSTRPTSSPAQDRRPQGEEELEPADGGTVVSETLRACSSLLVLAFSFAGHTALAAFAVGDF